MMLLRIDIIFQPWKMLKNGIVFNTDKIDFECILVVYWYHANNISPKLLLYSALSLQWSKWTKMKILIQSASGMYHLIHSISRSKMIRASIIYCDVTPSLFCLLFPPVHTHSFYFVKLKICCGRLPHSLA